MLLNVLFCHGTEMDTPKRWDEHWLVAILLGLPVMVSSSAVQRASLSVDDILAAQRRHLASTAAAHPIGHNPATTFPNRGYLQVGTS